MRRASWRSVPKMCRPPTAMTSSCSLSVCSLVAVEDLGPLLGGNDVLVAGVVPDRALGRRPRRPSNLALRRAQRLRDSLLHALLLGHELRIAAEQNVGAAAGHVGGDRDHALASGLGHDLGFALVILGVQHDVLDALLLQQLGKPLRFFDRRGADQHRLSGCRRASESRPQRRNTFLFPCDRRRQDSPAAALACWSESPSLPGL